jgi:hypothetical protein
MVEQAELARSASDYVHVLGMANSTVLQNELPGKIGLETLITSSHALQLSTDRAVVEMLINARHQKDVTIGKVDDVYYMISSASEVDDQSDWKMRSYVSQSVYGPWASHGIVSVEGASSPRMCAAGVICDAVSVPNAGEATEVIYRMLVQTECFDEGGTIEYAESSDGIFYADRRTVLESMPGTAFAGIYDAEPTVITRADGMEELYCTFTGVTRYENGSAKDGAIYLAKATQGWDSTWQVIKKPLFTEYSIPVHVPTLEGGEWVPEGGKALQISVGKAGETAILFYGTCFVDGQYQTRQRGFLAMADAIAGDYTFLGTLEPRGGVPGETGHGTIVEERDVGGDLSNDMIHIIHQARDKGPGLWRTERTTINKGELLELYAEKKQANNFAIAA